MTKTLNFLQRLFNLTEEDKLVRKIIREEIYVLSNFSYHPTKRVLGNLEEYILYSGKRAYVLNNKFLYLSLKNKKKLNKAMNNAFYRINCDMENAI